METITTEESLAFEMEELQNCVSDGMCYQCGVELDAFPDDCDCMCHEMV